MRTIRYYVINKSNGQSVYTNCKQSKCIDFINAQESKEQFAIGHKWLNI